MHASTTRCDDWFYKGADGRQINQEPPRSSFNYRSTYPTYDGTLLADVCTVKIPKKAEAMQVMVELALTGKDMAEEPKRTSIKYIGGSSMLDTQEREGVLDFGETFSFQKLAGHSHLRISL